MGQESLTVSILANLLFPYIPPLQGLSPHNPRAVHLPRYSLGELAQTLEPTFYTAVDATTNSYIPSAEQNPTPGITWNSCCSPCLMGLEEPPTACGVPLSSMASPPSALVRLQESLDRGNSTPAGLFTKDPQNHPQAPGPPIQRGISAAFTAHPRFLPNAFTLLNLQESEVSNTSQNTSFTEPCSKSRTQPSQYTVLNLQERTQLDLKTGHSPYSMPSHQSAHICICVTQKRPLPARAPFRLFTLSMVPCTLSLYFSQ